MWVLIIAAMTAGETDVADVGYFNTEIACTVSGQAVAEYIYENASSGSVRWDCLYQPIAEGVMG